MTSRYIAIDWGSTNLRAWLYQDEQCLESRQSEAGVTRLNGRTPEAVLAQVTEGWRDDATPVVMAGMVGSNAGWKIAPYLPCPARFADIGSQLTTVAERAFIIPGLCVSREDNRNVMRGEETQLLGARELAPAPLYIMPGTHCKWVQADAQQVNDFRTVMTGELHHLLLTHSLIGAGLPEQQQSADAFNAGLEQGAETDAPLTRLFEVRAAHVLGSLAREHVAEFLSGLLIGNEVASQLRHWQPDSKQPLTLVASPSLASRYQRALSLLGYTAQALEGDRAFQTGIRSLAHAVAE
ncbi:2-dehydro-3-deoxygalactonokinase [Cronobacter malonaticus]|uniref:2-oxo-3-deoxygalactonate kinase n=1 Tax=Cronobacter malonaticus TaxID=413503 RepID=A0A423XR83_9ENTR|nr:2-dehydro-3-deoxygalactonokinase [Cronobacter malonaticus]EGT4373777.1 2-oxo-3-deoxygalactonate kinase [Cronobacter malonaticus]ELY4599628.1 2-dehydro-3-deoxygalactonokinase [Cronobacter malonaticus]ELY5854879.1 2-dehydro-3-deoxygalactonokinase [Cronobacter malonaticus]ELY6229838.1 2-dehydro-3-deoxygalactonokinase [Cronobacter malonaticus]MDI6467288.1 2-dehydro-3-deoxygalactonokinase [Cronobacter malonaticus]